MKIVWVALLLSLSGLGGCAEMLKQQATEKLQQRCAEKGMQFVQTKAVAHEAVIVSSAEVEGECVGPGDPRYVQPRS